MPDVITEGRYTGEFLVSEANGYLSRYGVTVLADQVLKAGHVVGKITEGAKTAVGAAGNPAPAAATITAAPTAAITTKPGVHLFQAIQPGSGTASKWQHIDPDGEHVGVATGNTAYAGGGLSGLTITDASTDPVVGETFTVTVSEAAASGKYKEYNPANTDGSEVPDGILYAAVDATGADKDGLVIGRQAEINTHILTWFTGATDEEKAAALAQLASLKTIIGRT